jgi:hypothetical protein
MPKTSPLLDWSVDVLAAYLVRWFSPSISNYVAYFVLGTASCIAFYFWVSNVQKNPWFRTKRKLLWVVFPLGILFLANFTAFLFTKRDDEKIADILQKLHAEIRLVSSKTISPEDHERIGKLINDEMKAFVVKKYGTATWLAIYEFDVSGYKPGSGYTFSEMSAIDYELWKILDERIVWVNKLIEEERIRVGR